LSRTGPEGQEENRLAIASNRRPAFVGIRSHYCPSVLFFDLNTGAPIFHRHYGWRHPAAGRDRPARYRSGEMYEDWQFAHYARSAQGTILTKSNKSSSSRRGKKRKSIGTKHYEASYRFDVDGKTYDGEDELTHKAWDRLAEGQAAEILYLPDHPGVEAASAGPRPSVEKTLFGIIGLASLLVGGLLVLRGRRGAPAMV
jgi:hypothetical protein